MLFPNEAEAAAKVVQIGSQFGYGNMIGFLVTAWARDLSIQWGIPEHDACKMTHCPASIYPLAYFNDVMKKGKHPDFIGDSDGRTEANEVA